MADESDENRPLIPPGYGTDAEEIRAKCRLLTLEGMDGRTAAYRETKRLIDEVTADLGGAEHLSAAEKQMVQHAAVLGAIATDLEAQHLKGRRIDLNGLATVLNAQRRCFEAVGYRRRQRDVTPTLEGYLGSLKEPK
jgi:hypothetical protein